MTDYATNVEPRGNILNGISRILDKPRVFVYRTAGHPVAGTGAAVKIIWDSVDTDVEGMFSTGTNTRITCVTAGLWQVEGWVLWPANGNSYRQLWIMKNNALTFSSVIGPNQVPTVTSQELSRQIRLTAGDYLELAAGQGTGGILTLPATGGSSAFDHGFQACWIST